MNTDSATSKISRNPGILAVLIWAIISSAVLMLLAKYNFLPEAPDKMTYDWRIANFSDQSKQQRKDIAVVLISDDTLENYWARSPVDRGMLAELIKAIDAAGAKAIGLDFIFDRKAPPEKQNALIDAIKNANAKMVIGAIDKRSQGIKSSAFERQNTFIEQTGREAGHIYFKRQKNRFMIDDDIVRFIGEQAKDGSKREAFSELLAQSAKKDAKMKSGYIAWLLAPEQGGKSLFPTIYVPAHEPVDGSGDGSTVLPEHFKSILKDKIVLVGGDFVDMDRHLTPLSYFGQKKTPGVFIHAQVIAQLLDDRAVFDLNKTYEFIALFLLGAIGFYLGFRFNLKKYDFIMGVVGVSLLIAGGVLAFALLKTILPSTSLSLAWVVGVTAGHMYFWFRGYLAERGKG